MPEGILYGNGDGWKSTLNRGAEPPSQEPAQKESEEEKPSSENPEPEPAQTE